MSNIAPQSRTQDAEVRMGSEYASAKTYLAQIPRPVPPHRKKPEPQHGSNDSDFGCADQLPD